MRSVPVSDFIPTLRQLVNVPLPGLMADAVVKAAQTFCRQSNIAVFYRSFDQVAAGQTISLVGDSPENAEAANSFKCAELFGLAAGGQPLVKNTDYRLVSRDEIHFLKTHHDVTATCALEPANRATQLPAVLLDDHLDGICAGAASLLYKQPDSDWFNADMAYMHERQFVQSYREAARFRMEASPELSFQNPVRKRDFC